MKKILISFTLLLLILLSINNNVFAVNEKIITLEELKSYLEIMIQEEEAIKSVNIKDGAIEFESTGIPISKLYYDSENNTFYSEETFDNTMTVEQAKDKLGRNKYSTILWLFGSF